jgi:hypothetical protein
MNAVRWLALLLVVAAILWIRIVPRVFHESGLVPAPPTTEAKATDDAASITARFGKPDADVTAAAPPGALPTRVVTYRDLRIIFVQRDSTSGRLWKLVGFVDTNTHTALSGDEALRRLLKR